MTKQSLKESTEEGRAAMLFWLLGAADLLLVVAGETLLLMLFMIGVYFWAYLLWVAVAAYAVYISWAHTRHRLLHGLSAIAVVHGTFMLAFPGVTLPWGGLLAGPLQSESIRLIGMMGWLVSALLMVVLGLRIRSQAKHQSRSKGAE